MLSGVRQITFLIGIVILVINDKVINAKSNDVVNSDVGGLFHIFIHWNHFLYFFFLPVLSSSHFSLVYMYNKEVYSCKVGIFVYATNIKFISWIIMLPFVHFTICDIVLRKFLEKRNLIIFISFYSIILIFRHVALHTVTYAKCVFGNPSFSHIRCCYFIKSLNEKSKFRKCSVQVHWTYSLILLYALLQIVLSVIWSKY